MPARWASLALWVWYLCTGVGREASAQSTLGCFTFLTDSVGCAPFTVGFQNCYTPGLQVAYNFDFSANPGLSGFVTSTDPTGNAQHTYAAPGNYQVRQIQTGGSISRAARRVVTIYPQGVKPVFRLTSCPNSIQLFVQDTIFSRCRIAWAGQTQEVSVPQGGVRISLPTTVTSATPVEVTVTGLQPANCGNTALADTIVVYPSIPPARLDSATGQLIGLQPTLLTSLPLLKDVAYQVSLRDLFTGAVRTLDSLVHTEASGQIAKAYPFAGFGKYRLRFVQAAGCPAATKDSLLVVQPTTSQAETGLAFRSLAPDAGQQQVSVVTRVYTLSPTDTLFTDTLPFRCNEERCYILTTTANGRLYRAYPICLRAQTGAGQGLMLLASGWSDSLRRHTLTFDRRNAIAQFLGQGLLRLPASRPTVALPGAGCLPIGFADSCGNNVPGTEAFCPLALDGRLEADTRILTVQPLRGPGLTQAADFFIRARTTTGELLQESPIQSLVWSDRSKFPQQTIVYQAIMAPARPGMDTSFSNPVTLTRTPYVQLPQAFSPNGDEINDTLVATSQFLQAVKVTVFDSWGSPVYSSGLPFRWAGTAKGQPMPAGNYLAIIKAQTQDGKNFAERKWFALVR